MFGLLNHPEKKCNLFSGFAGVENHKKFEHFPNFSAVLFIGNFNFWGLFKKELYLFLAL